MESGEGIESQPHLPSQTGYQYVESGEGIESSLNMKKLEDSLTHVESGEGIERYSSEEIDFERAMWNPVKELKDYDDGFRAPVRQICGIR